MCSSSGTVVFCCEGQDFILITHVKHVCIGDFESDTDLAPTCVYLLEIQEFFYDGPGLTIIHAKHVSECLLESQG